VAETRLSSGGQGAYSGLRPSAVACQAGPQGVGATAPRGRGGGASGLARAAPPHERCHPILAAIEHGDPQAAERTAPAGLRRTAPLADRKLARESPARPSRPRRWSRGVPPAGRPRRGAALERSRPLPRRRRRGDAPHPHRPGARPQAAEAGRRPPSPRAGPGVAPEADAPADDLLDLDEAIGRLSGIDAQAAALVKLRLFAGLTVEQAASASGGQPSHRRARLDVRPHLALRQLGPRDEPA
jgi:hypothetical protein